MKLKIKYKFAFRRKKKSTAKMSNVHSICFKKSPDGVAGVFTCLAVGFTSALMGDLKYMNE